MSSIDFITLIQVIHTLGHVFNVEMFVAGYDAALSYSNKTENTIISGLISTLSLQKNGVNPVSQNSNPVFEAIKLLPGITGIVLCIVLSAIASSASETIRRSFYNLFWYSHQILAFLFYVMFIFHGFQGVVKKQTNLDKNDPQKCYKKYLTWGTDIECDIPKFSGSSPSSWMWVIAPILVYSLERFVRFIRGLQGHQIEEYVIHPSEVLELKIHNSRNNRIKYRAGQYIYLNIRSLSFFEWHPFTITSAPNDSELTVHIRCAGDWTSKLHKEILSESSKNPKINNLSIDGPYGTCADDVFKYPKVVLIGAGIGVTPYSSILKHIWNIMKNCDTMRLQKVYFFWIAPSIDTFEWFGHLLKSLEIQMIKKNMSHFLEYKLYLTRGWSNREAKQIARNHNETYDLFTGLEQKTNYGRPNFDLFFKELAQKATQGQREKVGVFFCGPPSFSTELHKICNKCSNKNIQFRYNKENF